MTRYELSRSKPVTLAAIILEVSMLIACILLADSVFVNVLNIPTMMAEHAPLNVMIAAVLVLQYMILITELIARYREDRRGFTIPLAFLPGGIVARTCLMAVLSLIVIVTKLIVYFLSGLFAFVSQIFRFDKYIGTSHLVDITDRLFEPLEYFVNCIYNFLYYNKIHANTSVFTAVFNCNLSFWCINH